MNAKHSKMNKTTHVNPQLKLFGIDQVIAVLKDEQINREKLSGWSQKNLKISIIQVNEGLNLSLLKKQLKRDLNKSSISVERTLIISDFAKAISRLKGMKPAMILGLLDEEYEPSSLYESGADLVVKSLKEIEIVEGNALRTSFSQTLPSAFNLFTKFQPTITQREPLLFFDYDGTLAPITRDPAQAYLPAETRKLLAQIAERFRVAIVSGRDMNDLKNFIGLDSLIYAGSHGYRISGPEGMELEHEKVSNLLPRLDKFMEMLSGDQELKIKGVEIERKHMAIAVHYRNAPSGTYKIVKQAIKKIITPFDEFTTGRGKKVIEIQPSLNWHKGKAVEWIMETLEQKDNQSYLPVYLGDDVTDEDAFKALPKYGIGILVGEHFALSAACCHLSSVEEVQKLLNYLVNYR